MNQENHEDETNIPEPFFHFTDNFSSAYFGEIPENLMATQPKNDKQLMSNIISLITDPRNRELREDVLKLLRENDARELLLAMLVLKDYRKHRNELLVACWESGLDFSASLLFFCEMLTEQDQEIGTSLEILTVLEEMPGPFSAESVEKSVKILANLPQNSALYPIISTVHRKIEGSINA